MTSEEAIELLNQVIKSLRDNPSQFHFEISVTGFKASNTGGVGYQVSPVGGGPGSTTIGMMSSPSSGDISIAQKRATDETEKQINDLVSSLEEFTSAVRENDAPKATSILQKVQNFLPIVAVILEYVLKSYFKQSA